MERLPPEVGEQSFKLLSLKDLCSLALTSSRVGTLVSNPTLWSNMRVRKQRIKQDGLAKLFYIKRFSKLRKIDLSRMAFSSEDELQSNLRAISSSFVQELSLEGVNLKLVPVNLLAHTVGYVRKINLDYTQLTTPQCFAVLETCISSPTLVDLSIKSALGFMEVPAALLGEAAGHLHSLDLYSCWLALEHCLAVLETCISSPALTNVSLGRVGSMSGVDASLLARAAVNLKMLNLDATQLTSEQCTAVLDTCKDTSPLVYLNLGHLPLEEVPSPLLKQAVRHLQKFDLFNSDLITEQCYALLEAFIANETCKIVIHEHFAGFLVPEILLDLLDKARDTGRLTERNYQQDDFVIDF